MYKCSHQREVVCIKTAVITGASRGIGLELAKFLMKDGYFVYCLSRSAPNQEEIDDMLMFRHVECDVSDETSIKKACAEILEEAESIDILVNNAGIGVGGSIEHTAASCAKRIININLLGVVLVTSKLLPKLHESKGRIVNISSVGGVFALPYQALYSATKAGVISFSDALRNELRPFGVRVMTVLPADVKTDFSRTSNIDDGVYAEFSKKSIAKMERDEQNGMTPRYVARKTYRAMRRRRMPQQRVIGRGFGVLMFLTRFAPKRFVNWLVFKLYGGV